MVAFFIWLDKRYRLRQILRKREERLFRRLLAKRSNVFYCTWDDEQTSRPEPILRWKDVEEVFGRRNGCR